MGSQVSYFGTGSNFGSKEFTCQYMDSVPVGAKVTSIKVTAPMSRLITSGGNPLVTISIGSTVIEQRVIATPPAECASPSEVFQSQTYDDDFPGYVKSGANTFRLTINDSYGIAMRDYATQIEVTYETPPPVEFAITDKATEAERRVLISNARLEYPYPHFQTVGGAKDAEVTTYLRARAPNGNLAPGLTVYMRIADPLDSAPYMNQPGNVIAQKGDNYGATATLDGTGITLHSPGIYQATSGANGRVDFTLRMQAPFAAGDNYQIEASLNPAFPAALTAKSGILTAWKRVFIEKRRMLKNGLFLAQDANAGDTFIVTRGNNWGGNEGANDSLSKGEKIVITHGPQFDRSDLDSGWYYETHTILSVEDLNDGRYRVNLGTKQGKTVIPEPLQHDYRVETSDETIGDGISKLDTLTLSPDDYFDASPDLVTGEAFRDAFTENIFLPDSTPGALVPVPFIETAFEPTLQRLAEKWSSAVVNGALLPNHQLLVIASDNNPTGAGDAAGVTISQLGARTSSYVFRHAIATQLGGKNAGVNEDRWAMKTAAHEIAHQWKTNAVWNLTDHCPATTKVYNDSSMYCLLADFDSAAAGAVEQRTNGVARFHLLPLSGGGWHSEHLEIRRRSDPFVP